MEYTFPNVSPHTQNGLIKQCEQISNNGALHGADAVGTPWLLSGRVNYNHLATPNKPSCIGSGYGNFFCPLTASSRHSGTVNVAFGDGHVKSITNSVDLTVWRAIGSRDGGEVIDVLSGDMPGHVVDAESRFKNFIGGS